LAHQPPQLQDPPPGGYGEHVWQRHEGRVVSDEPYCFVLMPIGPHRDDGRGDTIDFDRIYTTIVRPAVEEAGLRPLRDDDLGSGGLVQKFAFEALLACDFVLADLTTPNPNVMYELGIRHAARPSGTLAMTARAEALPFAVHSLRCLRYELDQTNVVLRREARRFRAALAGELRAMQERGPLVDSPVFQLVPEWHAVAPLDAAADLPGQSRRTAFAQAHRAV